MFVKFQGLKILVHMRQEDPAAPSHQGRKSQKREQAQLLLFSRGSSPGWSWHPCFAFTSLLFDSFTAFGIASPEPTLFPRGLHLNRGLMLCGKQKKHQRHFLCLVLEGSEMEPLQALGTRPGHSPRTADQDPEQAPGLQIPHTTQCHHLPQLPVSSLSQC